jgi:hypothetical protein
MSGFSTSGSGIDIVFSPLGPTTVSSASLQVVGTVPLVKATRYLPTNGIAFLEFHLYAVHESSAGVYGESWRINQAVQMIAGPSYRLGTLISKSQLHATSTTPAVLGGSTSIAVDISGDFIRLLVQAGDGLGNAKCWASVKINRSLVGS